MKKYITALIKLTNHPKDFLNGNLYCNTWEYMSIKYDKSEMIHSFSKFQFRNPWIKSLTKLGYYDEMLKDMPMFCMFAYYSEDKIIPHKIKISKKVAKTLCSPKRAIVITDVKKFINQVQTKLPDFFYESIDYVDYTKYLGITFFNPITTKDGNYFYHENEFRIYAPNYALTRKITFDYEELGFKIFPGLINDEKMISEKFNIGDIRKIAFECSADELVNGIKKELIIDWSYCHRDQLIKLYN